MVIRFKSRCTATRKRGVRRRGTTGPAREVIYCARIARRAPPGGKEGSPGRTTAPAAPRGWPCLSQEVNVRRRIPSRWLCLPRGCARSPALRGSRTRNPRGVPLQRKDLRFPYVSQFRTDNDRIHHVHDNPIPLPCAMKIRGLGCGVKGRGGRRQGDGADEATRTFVHASRRVMRGRWHDPSLGG